jgi:alcohol dehydrogenase
VVAGLASSIGLYAVAIAGALGAGRVRYVDGDAERMAVAEALGAEVEERGAAWPRRFERAPITVDATGDPEGLATVLRSTESYGRCTSVAIYFGDVSVPMLGMYTRGITFHTSRADSRRYLPDVLELIADGRLDPGAVPITRVDWANADEAWLSPAIKLVVMRS